MRYIPAVGALTLVLCIPFFGSAEDKSAEAASHFKKGVALFNDNKKEEAVQEFNLAYEIKPSWKIMYNIGQCHASLKRYGLAIESFEKYLGQGGDEVPKDRQDEILSELERLRKMVGAIKVHGPDGVEIYVDKILRGTTPMASSILATAGVEHWIWLIKDGKKLLSVQETLSGTEPLVLTVPADNNTAAAVVAPVGGETATGATAGPETAATAEQKPETTTETPAESAQADKKDPTKDPVTPPPAEKGGLKPVIFIATASAAVVFGGAAGGLAVAINSKWENSVEKIYDSPWDTDTEAVAANIHTMQILGYVSMGLAAASLIAAVTVIPFTNWKGKKSEQPKKTAAVSAMPWADADGGGLLLKGRF